MSSSLINPVARLAAGAAVVLTFVSPAHAVLTTFTVDSVHSSVTFKVRHLVSHSIGRFTEFEGVVTLDPEDPKTLSAEGSIDVASVDTDNSERDKHLRGEDFFDSARFPKITFRADRISEIDEDAKTAKVHGKLTMHGVTESVVLDARWHGTAVDPWGKRKAGFSATVTLDRKDFGIVYNKVLDAGGFILGDTVEIDINVEASY